MPQKTVKIAFRGLMVLNYQGSAPNRFMEIGFLDARAGSAQGNPPMGGMPDYSTIHIPRVLTMENGVLADLLDLRNRPDLLGVVRRWELRAVNPVGSEATLKGTGPADRKQEPTDSNREDFKWIVDLEGPDMHNKNLTADISTARLLMVLIVRNGEFSTKLISPFLNRETLGGGTDPFGFAAAVTGLDITCTVSNPNDEGAVDLLAGSTLVKRLQPKKGRDTVFEISNAPPDVPAEAANPIGAAGHFHMYYDKLFINHPPDVQFDFEAIGSAPAPDPALCGVTFLSQRTDGL